MHPGVFKLRFASMAQPAFLSPTPLPNVKSLRIAASVDDGFALSAIYMRPPRQEQIFWMISHAELMAGEFSFCRLIPLYIMHRAKKS